MKSDEIQRLVQIVEQANIAELELTSWGRKVKITKYAQHVHAQTAPAWPQQSMIPMPGQPQSTSGAAASSTSDGASVEDAPAQAKGEEMKSPMVGTFYRAPAPDAEPYVKVGDTVKEGHVLCIIEAMKLMNEVEAEFSCRIIDILVENAQPVEYNQPLFLVEKL